MLNMSLVRHSVTTTSATKCVPTNILQLLKKWKLYSIWINRMMQKNEGGGWNHPPLGSPRVNMWNSLPNYAVEANTVNLFKARLDRFWANQDVNYDCTANLTGIGELQSVRIMWFIVSTYVRLFRYGHWGVSLASVDARWVELSWVYRMTNISTRGIL